MLDTMSTLEKHADELEVSALSSQQQRGHVEREVGAVQTSRGLGRCLLQDCQQHLWLLLPDCVQSAVAHVDVTACQQQLRHRL